MAGEVTLVATPTEENPDRGRVAAVGGVVLSDAEHWVEDGVHVIRSTEFPVIAGADDFDGAVDQFGEKLEDLWLYLSEIETLTDNENELFLALAPRFRDIYRELERREAERQRRIIILNLRRRGAHLRNWVSTPEHSSAALPV